MNSSDPYAMHALLLVFGADRGEIVRNLRDEADAIERADDNDGSFDPIIASEGGCIVRKSYLDIGGNEEAGACRMFGVFHAESDDTSPIALFAEPDAAYRFAGCGVDLCVMRADVIMSAFNHVDQKADPHASEAP